MRNTVKSIIVLGNEAIWIYYIVALFTSLEWGAATFVNPTWWIIAPIVGFLLNYIFMGRIHHIPLGVFNIIAFSLIALQNWRFVVPEDTLFFGIFLSFSLLFLYARAISFFFNVPTRMQILYRFEGSIIIYALLLLAFSAKGWLTNTFHLVFLIAIFTSLLGIALTLNEREKVEADKQIDVYKVSNAGVFSTVTYLLFFIVLAVSSALFLPSLRSSLQSLAHTGLAGVTWLVKQMHALFIWLVEWLPEAGDVGDIPSIEQGQGIVPPEVEGDVTQTIQIEWLFIGIGVIVVLVLTIVFIRLMQNWQSPLRRRRKVKITVHQRTLTRIWQKLLASLRQLLHRWQGRFPQFYKKQIYWKVSRLQRLGKKNGFGRHQGETVREYIHRIIHHIEQKNTHLMSAQSQTVPSSDIVLPDDGKVQSAEQTVEEWDHLIPQLQKLCYDFELSYYGNIDQAEGEADRELLKNMHQFWRKTKSEINTHR